MGKHSGRAALRSKLKELGFDLADNQLNDVFVRFKALADRKKEVYDDDLIALVSDEQTNDAYEFLQLKKLRVSAARMARRRPTWCCRSTARTTTSTRPGTAPWMRPSCA
jgi:isopropylmalate/homocitrate/citramalate synthase